MKINSLHDVENIDNVTFDQLLNDILDLNEEEYIKTLRSNLNGRKVFLKRKPLRGKDQSIHENCFVSLESKS